MVTGGWRVEVRLLCRWMAWCGFDRLPAVDAGRRPALRSRAAGAGLRAGGPFRYRITGGWASPQTLAVEVDGVVWFRPPLGGRCRPEAGAPISGGRRSLPSLFHRAVGIAADLRRGSLMDT